MGMLLLIVAGVLVGQWESLKLSLRVRHLEELLVFIKNIETEIRFSSVPLLPLLKKYSKTIPWMRICVKHMESGEDFSGSWKKAVGQASGVWEKERDLLLRLGEGLGKTDLQGQISHCEMIFKLLEEVLEKAKEEQKNKSRIYQTLGAFGGIAIALLIG